MNAATDEPNFFEQWAIYQKVIRQNYMFHTEIIQQLQHVIGTLPTLKVLDIGCGDSYVLRESLLGRSCDQYVGIDMSQAALDVSREHLKDHVVDLQYYHDDFLSVLPTLSDKFDLIISGYSLHHVSTQQKRDFFEAVDVLLEEQGVLFFYDIQSEPGESVQGFRDRSCDVFRSHWAAMPSIEIEGIVDHVQNNDYPECAAFYQEQFRKHKLQCEHQQMLGEDNVFALYCVRKLS